MAYVGIAMLAFVAFTVIGVDVGRLGFTAAEVQSVADTAAVAAMSAAMRGRPNPVAEASEVVAKNWVDGGAATIGSAPTDIIQTLEPGTYDFATGVFTPNGGNWVNAGAAHAVGTKTVDNFLAGMLGSVTSNVRRDAVAAVSGVCQGRAVLPIALGECYFTQFETSNPPNCALLPTLTQVPNVGNTCWTSLVNGNANQGDVTQYFPTQCCGNGNTCGSNAPPAPLHVGGTIGVINGQVDPVLRVIESCRAQGITDWDIPIIPCGSCNQSATVVGFAHIHISAVRESGTDKGVDLSSLCKATPGDGGGCTNIAGFTGLSIVK
jgi:hypothetical protein